MFRSLGMEVPTGKPSSLADDVSSSSKSDELEEQEEDKIPLGENELIAYDCSDKNVKIRFIDRTKVQPCKKEPVKNDWIEKYVQVDIIIQLVDKT